MPTDIFYIASGTDDGWGDTGGVSLDASAIAAYHGSPGGTASHNFFRFDNVAIPAGATITDAFVRFTAHFSDSSNTVNVTCHFEAADDPAAPITGNDLVNRSLTTGTAWNSIGNTTAGNTFDSPDISSELQEVIDRFGWVSGQAVIANFVDNGSTSSANRSIKTYEGSVPDVAALHVTWTEFSLEKVTITENINLVLGFSGELPLKHDGIVIAENINIELYQPWNDISGGDNVAIIESIAIGLEEINDTLITQELRVAENIDVSLVQSLSGADTVGLSEHIAVALDIPTNWIALANAGLTVERFYFTLTGEADSTTDIDIPIESFQARKRTGDNTYLSLVVRDYPNYADEISDRANGEMIVEMAYEYAGDSSIRQEILRADLQTIDIYDGPNNRSIVLTGYKSINYINRTVTLYDSRYRSVVQGNRTLRFLKIDPYLNPGDTCISGADTFTVDYIVYVVNDYQTLMEVKEGQVV